MGSSGLQYTNLKNGEQKGDRKMTNRCYRSESLKCKFYKSGQPNLMPHQYCLAPESDRKICLHEGYKQEWTISQFKRNDEE